MTLTLTWFFALGVVLKNCALSAPSGVVRAVSVLPWDSLMAALLFSYRRNHRPNLEKTTNIR
jgi:hypothetical protein